MLPIPDEMTHPFISYMTHPNLISSNNHLMTCFYLVQIGYAPHHPAYRERTPTSNRPWATTTGRGEKLTGDLTGDLTGRAVNSSHPASLTYNLTMMGFEESELVEAGLTVDGQSNYGRGDHLTGDLTGARYRYYDRFRGRLMVPIRNEQGVVVAFGGRALDIPSQNPSQTMSAPDPSSTHTHALSTLAVATKASTSGRARVTLERGVHLTGDLTGGSNIGGTAGVRAGVTDNDVDTTVTTSFSTGTNTSTATGTGIGVITIPTVSAGSGTVSSNSNSNTVAKYLNSPESALFKKGQTLYGMDLARHHIAAMKQVVMVEGYFDVIAMHDVGVVHAVGT